MAFGHRPLGKNPHLETGVRRGYRLGRWFDVRGARVGGGPEAAGSADRSTERQPNTRSEAEGKNKG